MKQYEVVARKIIPALAPDPENLESDPSWSQEQAEAAFFQRLTLEESLVTDRGGTDGDSISKNLRRIPISATQATWRNVWTLCAAGVLLCIALGVSAYRVGIRRGTESASVAPVPDQSNQIVLQQQLSDAGHERKVLRSEMAQRDKVISDLRAQFDRQSAEMSRMKVSQNQLETDLSARQTGRQELLQQRSDLNQKLEAAESRTQVLQDRLSALDHQASDDKQRSIALEAKLTDLNRLLRDRETTIDQQQELLAHDRDIRDLMGARDLYVAEVYDVERTGETKKAYGRVFYTKGKSLIFYAYDLDQQPGVKNASTFQAWGRRGPDWQQALNLGVFYVDNASKKRWVLRFDDPKALAQIDAVFVTVEPNGGSHKPTSKKPLLFAYLHIDPNHP
jgi:predicted  nucleic acid-binding Zn-ribbon protein